jgi:hypothetical protein
MKKKSGEVMGPGKIAAKVVSKLVGKAAAKSGTKSVVKAAEIMTKQSAKEKQIIAKLDKAHPKAQAKAQKIIDKAIKKNPNLFKNNSTKAVKTAKQVKNARATKDAKIVSSSPYLKQTPNMTIKQAKAMKQGTKQLSKTTKRISKESNRRKSDNVSVGEFNDFLKKMGLDKPTTFPSSGKMKALDTPSIGGKINAPSNMTLKDVNRASALDDAQKAKAYAAAYRVAKRETKGMKKAMESKKVRTTKKVVKGTAVAGTAGGAYAASKKKKGK